MYNKNDSMGRTLGTEDIKTCHCTNKYQYYLVEEGEIMSDLLRLDEEYRSWIQELGVDIEQARLKRLFV